MDDYLSDAYLVEAASTSSTTTYAEQRKRAKRDAEIKNQQNRKRSRKELESDARESVLRTSLFQRAEEEAVANPAAQSRAMSMMQKMGFQPGQSLGRSDVDTNTANGHRTEPIPIKIWSGTFSELNI
jgi:hypothetical protein